MRSKLSRSICSRNDTAAGLHFAELSDEDDDDGDDDDGDDDASASSVALGAIFRCDMCSPWYATDGKGYCSVATSSWAIRSSNNEATLALASRSAMSGKHLVGKVDVSRAGHVDDKSSESNEW